MNTKYYIVATKGTTNSAWRYGKFSSDLRTAEDYLTFMLWYRTHAVIAMFEAIVDENIMWDDCLNKYAKYLFCRTSKESDKRVCKEAANVIAMLNHTYNDPSDYAKPGSIDMYGIQQYDNGDYMIKRFMSPKHEILHWCVKLKRCDLPELLYGRQF